MIDPSDLLPVNRIELSMYEFAGLRKVVDDYNSGLMTLEYYVYACKSICPALKEFCRNELVVIRPRPVPADPLEKW